MQDFLNKKIVLGICGGIAAYKSAFLVRELTRLGAKVRVVMTASATQFITPLTMQALSGEDVRSDLFDEEAERAMSHIELARWADYLLIAPATANFIAKMAHGIADDLLSTLYLVAETPILVCPAMNHSMWAHEATVHNCSILAQRGVIMVGPDEGIQACQEQGYGRLSEVPSIINALRLYEVHQLLKGRQVLITAGPTREAIDPVRYLSNRSSGKMGYALAEAALMANARVTLVSGPTTLLPPNGVDFFPVNSAMDMHHQVMQSLKPGMIFIGAAAVADYRWDKPLKEKYKKANNDSFDLHLTPNPDILTEVASSGKASYVVGFAAETNDLLTHAKKKLVAKKVDMIIANQVGESHGFDSDDNEVTLVTQEGNMPLQKMHKTRLAGLIIAILATNLQNVPQSIHER